MSALAVAVLAVALPNPQRAHARKAVTVTGIAVADSGDKGSRSARSKALEASKKKKGSAREDLRVIMDGVKSINRRP